MNILTRRSSFIPFLPRNLLESVPYLPKDSFFYRAFDKNIETANKVVNTEYLQEMKKGLLPPVFYGCLTVLDSYYCYRASETLDSLLCKIDEKKYAELKASVNIEPPLAQGSAFLEGDGLKLEISSSGKEELQIWHGIRQTDFCNMTDMTNKKANLK